jgi:FMN phosphatase YigB (HAD superfamily)
LAAIPCQPAEAVHIGDSLRHDIAGAGNVGIPSVWLNRKRAQRTDTAAGPDSVPDFEIMTLDQLLNCLAVLDARADG